MRWNFLVNRSGLSARRQATHPWSVVACATAALSVPTLLAGWQAGPATQAPVLRSGVELVTVDATVVDRTGRPVEGLGPDDFGVTVDGQPRRVVSADFVRFGQGVVPPVPPESDPQQVAVRRLRRYSSNEDTEAGRRPGRTIVLALDHASFSPMATKRAQQAAADFVARLSPSDTVVLAAFPEPEVFVPTTASREALLVALHKVTGTADRLTGTSLLSMSLSEAVEIDANVDATYRRVLDRECRGRSGNGGLIDQCGTDLQMMAHDIVRSAQNRARRSINGLASLLARLRRVEGRKTIVLVSGGLFSSAGAAGDPALGAIRTLSDAAQAANTALYVLHVDTTSVDALAAERRTASESAGGDRGLMASGLEMLAGGTGGALFQTASKAEVVFDAVSRELSATYVLGVEPEPSDKDGKLHSIRTTVRRDGVFVRSRQQLVIKAATDTSPEAELAALLRTGRVAQALPLSVRTFCLRDEQDGKTQVMIRADAGRGATAPANLHVALVVLDRQGTIAASSSEQREVVPEGGADGTWPYVVSATLLPGTYTLRLAVRDGAGRMGSVSHRFDTRLDEGDGIRFSEMFLYDATRFRDVEMSPLVDNRVTGSRVRALIEVYAHAKADVSRVELAVQNLETAAILVAQDAQLLQEAAQRTTKASATLDIGMLPPGEYQVTATAYAANVKLGRVVRGLTIEAPVGGGASTEIRFRFQAGEGDRLGRPFARDAVLKPEVLAYFLGRLKTVDAAGQSGPVGRAVGAAERGEFASAVDLLRTANPSALSVRFVRGLSKLAQNDPASAATEFLAALEVASDFLPAAFYLGACYAVGGQDEHAAGAWQTALITESDAKVIYDVLADAYLRMEQGADALAILAETREKWPEDDLFLPRLAVAQWMTGDRASAVSTLEGYLARHADDLDTTFLGVRFLFEAHRASRPVRSVPADLAMASTWATAYLSGGGPQASLVEAWLAYMRLGPARPAR